MKFKSHFKITAIIILAISMLSSCKDEEGLQPSEGQLLLKLQSTDLASSSGRTTIDMTPKSILMTLVSNGTETRKTLDLISFSGEYATNPISLSIGNYQITEFIVTNSDDEVIYVVPKKDSEFGNLVSQPLPISITISAEQVQTVAPQVVSVAGKSASQFGYIAFGIDVLPSFKITTMGMVDGVAEMITPRLVLTQASDTLLDYILEEAVNEVPYVDNGADLRLTLMEHGFARYSQVFSADSLSYYQNEPLLITSEEAMTLEMLNCPPGVISMGYLSFSLEFHEASSIIVDWGNNVNYDTLSGNWIKAELDSQFNETPYFISITGDLANVKRFFNDYLPVYGINVTHLSNLNWLILYATMCPEIDLRHNPELEYLTINNGNENLEYMDLSNNNKLIDFDIACDLKNIKWTGCDTLLFVNLNYCSNLEYPFLNIDSEKFSLNDNMIIECDFCDLSREEMDEFLRLMYENLEADPKYGGTLSLNYNSTPYSTGIYYKELIEEKYGWRISYSEEN